ncbi:MAG: DUF1302 family protein [Alphaproteobacteria bacterium]
MTVSARPELAHDVNGTSYDGAFNQGRQVLRLAVDGTVKDRYLFNLTYQTTLAGSTDPRADDVAFHISTGVKP